MRSMEKQKLLFKHGFNGLRVGLLYVHTRFINSVVCKFFVGITITEHCANLTPDAYQVWRCTAIGPFFSYMSPSMKCSSWAFSSSEVRDRYFTAIFRKSLRCRIRLYAVGICRRCRKNDVCEGRRYTLRCVGLYIIGPILWGHSGPLCHALSLWTSILHCHSPGVATVARRLRYSYSWLRLILVVV